MKSFVFNRFFTYQKIITQIKADESKIILVCKGSIKLRIENNDIILQPKSIVILIPWAKYSIESIDINQIKFQLITFYIQDSLDPQFNAKLIENTDHLYNIQLNNNQYLRISYLLRILHNILNYNKLNQEKIQASRYLLNSIVLDIHTIFIQKQISSFTKLKSYSPIVFNFLYLVGQNFNNEHSVNFYANELCITRRHLAKVIKNHTNQTPKSIIENAIYQEALNLLLLTSYNLSEISDKLGFHSYANFLLFFRKRFGDNPTNFRKKSY